MRIKKHSEHWFDEQILRWNAIKDYTGFFLTAMRRPNSSVSPDIIIDSAVVDYIERVLCEAERKSPRKLFMAIVVAPIARKIFRVLNKMSTEKG